MLTACDDGVKSVEIIAKSYKKSFRDPIHAKMISLILPAVDAFERARNMNASFDCDDYTCYFTNSTTLIENQFETEKIRHGATITALLCMFHALIFLGGLFGNCLVVAVVACDPQLRTVTNLFVANVALADILTIVFYVPTSLASSIFYGMFSAFNKLSFRSL